jgi:polysaccharide deacetylase 2 family uncharacterized protein YibQ
MQPVGRPGQGLWRALAIFWVLVWLGTGGTVAVLAWLGAPAGLAPRDLVPPAGPVASAAPDPAAPAPATLPTPPLPAPMPAPSATALAVPEAPEPPPLTSDEADAAEDRPIPPPDPALLEASPAGLLPRIAVDGRQPRHAYARPFDRADTRPRVALVMPEASEASLAQLPGAVALALPRASASLLAAARGRGMETLLMLPGAGGPLEPALARFAGYVGVLGTGQVPSATQQALRDRGLLVLDPRPGAPPPGHAWGRAADMVLANAPTRGEIDRQLAELERLARERGSALGLLPGPQALVVSRVAAWAAGLPQRGLVLAPVSAMIRLPSSSER